jgi:formylglycine-generating enzyme required for sulfatase activity
MLRKGHHGTKLNGEEWERLVTWIDLNAPCHGTWGDVYPIPEGMHEKRLASYKNFGGPKDDPEVIPQLAVRTPPIISPAKVVAQAPKPPANPPSWPFELAEAQRRQNALGLVTKRLDLGEGVTMQLVQIPAGEFLMGDVNGADDETNVTRVGIERSFWMGTCEINNEQYRRFDASHDPRYYGKRHATMDDQGLPLNSPQQPAVRVSWLEAMKYCRWLSERTGLRFSLPTEAQWEWACRAGSEQPMSFGDMNQDFSIHANLADQIFSKGLLKEDKQISGGLDHLLLEGADLAEKRFNDKFVVTAPVGSFQANAWGLHDMHGNAAEWTRSDYREYPYRENEGRPDLSASARKVVRGGSFFDPPRRSRSAARVSYPAWQKVFNVGFRVVCEEGHKETVMKQ